MSAEFGWIDYSVVGGTLLFSILIGVYYAIFAKQRTEDLLVGGRTMGIFPIAASMLVTYLSAITVLGWSFKKKELSCSNPSINKNFLKDTRPKYTVMESRFL